MISAAPTTPVSWLFAPERSATAVRDPLVLTGKPWNRPAARFAAPIPSISWLPWTSCPLRAANADAVEIVSASETRAMPQRAGEQRPEVGRPDVRDRERREALREDADQADAVVAPGRRRSSATIASTTITSTAGTFGSQRCSTRIRTIPAIPTAAAAGTASPFASPLDEAGDLPIRPSASTLNPNSFGSCPTRMVSARPFM